MGWLWISSLLFWTALYMSVGTVQVQAEYVAQLSPVALGVMTGLFGAGLLVVRIPVGIAFGKFNQKILLLSGLTLLVIGNAIVPLFFSPATLFVSKVLLGISAGFWVVYSLMYINYHSNQIPRASARITLTYGLGIMLGTFGGGLLVQQWGWLAPFWIGTIVGIAAIITLIPIKKTKKTPYVFDKLRLLLLFKNKRFLLISFLGFIIFFLGTSTVWGFTQNFAFEYLKAQPIHLGLIALAMLAPYALAIRFSHVVREKIGVENLIIFGLILAGVSTLLIPLSQNIPTLSFFHVLVGLGLGVVFATLMSLSVEGVAQEHRGEAMGVFQTIYAIGFLLGPITAGQIANSLGLPAIFYINGTIVLAVAITIFIAPLSKPFGDS